MLSPSHHSKINNKTDEPKILPFFKWEELQKQTQRMIDLELSSQNGMNESSENKMLETGKELLFFDMERFGDEASIRSANIDLFRLYEYNKSWIENKITRVVFFYRLFYGRLLFPLISIELVLYIVCIVGCWFWFKQDNEDSFTSLIIELAIAIPILFLYCDWNLCQDLYDKRRNIERFAAIELRLK